MKKLCNILIILFVSSILFESCDDLLGVDSNRLVTEQEYGNSSNDSLYSTFGILSQVQKLADSYVLLGELRGDLLDVSELSDLSLLEINNFDISKTNTYIDIDNYYSVINNCNYILQNLDSSKIDNGQKLEINQIAAIKSIRAWTYMQIALNFKTAKYYENAILSIEDARKTYPEYEFAELADKLIEDLKPFKDIPFHNVGYIGSYDTQKSYFPIRFLLGDLYLWKGDYENAAKEYFTLIYKNRYTVNSIFTSSWQTVNNTIGSTANLNWIISFVTNSSEVISTITCPTQYGQRFDLDSLNLQHKIVPSKIAIKNWENQTYFLNEASNSQGDLRKYGSVWWKDIVNSNASESSEFNSTEKITDTYYIMKYMLYNQNIIVYRSALLYLRYAEAMNRLNKPNVAYAILKYGLNGVNLYNTSIIPPSEKDSITTEFMNFGDARFSNNVGIRMRGVGNADMDTTFYKFQPQNSMQDSVLYVENLIQEELALETAFEGNRFQDLMRITLRRIKNGEGDASYLADPISAKHIGNESAIKSKLMDTNNWYIKQ